jgi:hypothetical protein
MNSGTRAERRPAGGSNRSDEAALAEEHVSLCEALDRVLNKGAVVVAEVMISVADIDLIYLSLQAIVCSVETARKEKVLSR